MFGGFVAVREGEVGDEDDLAAAFFGFLSDFLFRRGDEGGDEDSAVGGGVEPEFAVAGARLFAVTAVNDDLLFEGVAQEELVAVGLVALSADGDSINAPEKVRIGPTDGEAVGVGADVAVDGVEGAGGVRT